MDKICTSCGVEKNSTMFYKRAASNDGYRYACKECDDKKSREYRKSNPSVVSAIKKKYNKKNRSSINKWSRENPESSRKAGANRRARKRDSFVESIDREVLYNLCGGICYLCGKRVGRNSWHIEHVVPLAKKGKHSYKNTAIAHPSCNERKGTKSIVRVMYEENYGQTNRV